MTALFASAGVGSPSCASSALRVVRPPPDEAGAALPHPLDVHAAIRRCQPLRPDAHLHAHLHHRHADLRRRFNECFCSSRAPAACPDPILRPSRASTSTTLCHVETVFVLMTGVVDAMEPGVGAIGRPRGTTRGRPPGHYFLINLLVAIVLDLRQGQRRRADRGARARSLVARSTRRAPRLRRAAHAAAPRAAGGRRGRRHDLAARLLAPLLGAQPAPQETSTSWHPPSTRSSRSRSSSRRSASRSTRRASTRRRPSRHLSGSTGTSGRGSSSAS